MPVTTTPQDILNAAYAKSKKNQPGVIATESTELLHVVRRAFEGLYAVAARVNPTYFAESAPVAYVAPGWARPEAAESVFWIEKADGTPVAVVPHDDRTLEAGIPSVYPLGQVYRPAGTDPATSDTLTFFYARRPTAPAALDQPVDAQWCEQFNELAILETALHLAVKDERAFEVGALAAERQRWLALYIAFLEHETASLRRRFGPARPINTQSLLSLLAPAPAAA